MKDHVPDLERCKRLQEKGFPQDLQFFWATDWCDAWWVVHETDLGCNDMPIAAPIVTELVEEIGKFAKPQESEMLVPVIEMYLSEMGDWNVGSVAQFQITDEADYCNADALPNALADLWIWLRERGE